MLASPSSRFSELSTSFNRTRTGHLKLSQTIFSSFFIHLFKTIYGEFQMGKRVPVDLSPITQSYLQSDQISTLCTMRLVNLLIWKPLISTKLVTSLWEIRSACTFLLNAFSFGFGDAWGFWNPLYTL